MFTRAAPLSDARDQGGDWPDRILPLRHSGNRIACGVAAVSFAGVCLMVFAVSTASAIEPTETPTPTPGDATPVETPPGTPEQTGAPTPRSPIESTATPTDDTSPGPSPETPGDPATEAVPDDPPLDGPTETETPTPTPSPSPTPPWGKVNAYWLQKAREIANKYWLGDVFVRQMKQESGFNDAVITGQRVSSAGAEGVAQIMRKYHPGVDPLDPEAALLYAARHMQELLLKYDGNIRKALAAYNAGAIRVDAGIVLKGSDWLSLMPEETHVYLAKIMRPDEPDQLAHWDDLNRWWRDATDALGQRMHLRLAPSMVSVWVLPPPPEDLVAAQ